MSSWLTRNPGIQSKKNTFVTVTLMGGLANRIFQICAGKKYAELTRRTFVLYKPFIMNNAHEDNDKTEEALTQIFGTLPFHTDPKTKWITIQEEKYQWFGYHFDSLPKYPGNNVVLHGYWQNINYIPASGPSIAHSPIPLPFTFLHFRFGDYVGSPHELPLQHYYRKAIRDQLSKSPDTQFLVFTDDETAADTFIEKLGIQIQYTFSPARSAIDVLKGMANCIGGICANSSLSFLGAFFQRRGRGNIYMPSRWMNTIPDRQMSSFYPSWVTVVDLKDDRPPEFQDS